MPNKKEKELKKRIKTILLIVIGVVAFVSCVVTTIRGMSQAINKEPDTSGLVRIFS